MRWLAFIALLAMPMSVWAQGAVMYQRSAITLEQSEGGDAPVVTFDAELRDAASAQRAPGWYSFATLAENRASAMVYEAPVGVTIFSSNEFSPVDVLFVEPNGRIALIAENIIPAQLSSPIASPGAVKAVIYIRAGTAKAKQITVGDWLKHPVFAASRPVSIQREAPAPAPVPVPKPEDAATTTPAPKPEPEPVAALPFEQAASKPVVIPFKKAKPVVRQPDQAQAIAAPVVKIEAQDLGVADVFNASGATVAVSPDDYNLEQGVAATLAQTPPPEAEAAAPVKEKKHWLVKIFSR